MNIGVPEHPKLNATNRCDSCGHRAYLVTDLVFHDEVQTLEWCKHHFELHEKALTPIALTVWDERFTIVERLDVSA